MIEAYISAGVKFKIFTVWLSVALAAYVLCLLCDPQLVAVIRERSCL